MEEVFGNNDTRRYIFSFLRKNAKKQCQDCGCVCVWDKQVKPYRELNNIIYCSDCCYKNYNGPGCKIS